ncbi:MAG: hypothetical protein K8S62_00745 [Candidatus Sabulitectum sp.]|nr:hypothetical protein [Candidatus Sabulitectum sp.]
MIQNTDDLPEELTPAVLKKEFVEILDQAVKERPVHDIIAIRDEIRGNTQPVMNPG